MKSRVRKDEAEDRNSMLSSKTFYEMVLLMSRKKKKSEYLPSIWEIYLKKNFTR